MFIELINNLAIILSLGVVFALLSRYISIQQLIGKFSFGALFGLIAIVGMMNPYTLSNGVLFDGRSVILSIAALFAGPVVAFISMVIAILYRIWIGGTGASTGSIVIFSSSFIGLIFYYLKNKNIIKINVWSVTLMGFIVHVAMLLIMFTLPGELGRQVIFKLSLTVLILFTLSTTFLGMMLLDQQKKNSSQSKLIESENKFRKLYDSMAQGVIYQDSEGKVLDANPVAFHMLGFTREQLVNKTSLDSDWRAIREDGSDFPGKEHPGMVALQTGKAVNKVIMGIVNPIDQKYRWFKIDAIPQYKSGEKKPYQVFTTFDDITATKKIEISLKENEYRYIKAQQLGKVGNWEYNLKTAYFWASEEARRIFGFEPDDDDFDTEYVESCIPERDRVHQALVDLIEKGKEYNLEYVVHPKNGESSRIVNSIAELSHDSLGNPSKVMGVILDITKQKQIEESIRQSESILSASQRIASTGGWQWDVEKQKMFWTDETYQIHDFAKNEFEMGSEEHIEKSLNCYDPEDRELITKAFNKCIESGEKYQFIVPFKTAKGRNLWIKTSGEANWEDGKITKVTGVIQDVTEHKRAEEELRLSEAHFRSLMENVQGFVLYRLYYNKSSDTVTIQLVSPSIKQMLGVTDPYNLNEWFNNIHHEDLERVNEANSRSFKEGEPFDEVMRILYPDKENCRWVNAISYPVYSEKDSSVYFNGIIIDITQRKLAEEQLLQSEKKIRKALSDVERSEFLLNEAGRMAKIGAWEFDLATQKTRWSDQVFELHAIPIGEVPDFDFIMGCYVNGSEEILRKSIEECITLRKIYELELRFLNARNEKLWVRAIGYPIINDKDEIVSIRGVVQDITEQQNTNTKLIESEEKYRLLAENTHDVISLHDTDAKYLYVSPSIKNVRGYEPDELIGKNPYDFIHPDDIPLITTEAQIKKLEAGHPLRIEYRFRFKDGNYGWFESNRQAIFNDKKEIVKVVSISRDITDRIEREKEISNYQKSLQALTLEISLVEEKQRKEIAENIHDHLSQSLVISRMKLVDLQKEIKNLVSKNELKSVINHISKALENSRKITYDLSPPVLYELGLIETMYWLVEKIEAENKLKATFITELDELNLPEQKLILIYRIIQELVTNIVKHAKAGKIDISFHSKSEGMEITVIDDGEGFDVNKLAKVSMAQEGFGLFAVKERVQNLGGNLVIKSNLGKGTVVKIYVPL